MNDTTEPPAANTSDQPDTSQTPSLQEISVEATRFRDNFKSLQLGTASPKAIPCASYTPFVQLSEKQFAIYISDLAEHTANLKNNPVASVMFIEPENAASQLFARQRLTYRCEATQHERDSDEFNLIMDAFKQRFPGIMGLLENMTDFHLFTLTAISASYVRGFAQAYRFEDADLDNLSLRNDRGHDEKA